MHEAAEVTGCGSHGPHAGTPSLSIEPATPMLDEAAGNGLEEACARLTVDAANGSIRDANAENAAATTQLCTTRSEERRVGKECPV